ncbi:MAG: hypothetical protein ACJATA_001897 [Sphingobacteriales bacterium]|jgi:hypothetical protein
MKLPVIKHINKLIEEKDQDFVLEAIEVLEHITESSSLKDEDIDVIGELISNMYGAIEVNTLMKNGMSERDASNTFMKRVMGSIDS